MCCAARRKPSANKVAALVKFSFKINNLIIRNWHAAKAVKEPCGKISTALREKIFEDRAAAYVQDGKMK